MPPKARARKAPARKAAPRKATPAKPPTAPRSPGRPRKLEIDVNLQATIVDAITAGLTPERAAVAAGITERTHYRWQAAGLAEREHLEKPGAKPHAGAAIFLAYVDAIDQAVAKAELALLQDLRGGKVHALTILERRFPDRWTARKPSAGGGAGNGGPVAPTTPLGQLEQKRRAREQQRAT